MTRTQLSFVVLLIVLGVLAGSCGAGNVSGPALPSPTPVSTTAVLIPDATQARDAALAYVNAHYAATAPPAALPWLETALEQPDNAGTAAYQYTADTCIIFVTHPQEQAADTLFSVIIDDRFTGFYWEGQVNPIGFVTERAHVNVGRELSLAHTESIEILPPGGGAAALFIISDRAVIDALVAALDQDVYLQWPAGCVPSYTLRFVQVDNSYEWLDYGCVAGEPEMMGGAHAFWQGQIAGAPAEFVALLNTWLAEQNMTGTPAGT